MSFETTAILLAWVVILILALALAGLMRQFHLWAEGQRPEPLAIGPAIGSTVPEVTDLDARSGRPTLLLFVNDTCRGCERLLPALPQVARDHGDVQLVAMFPKVANGHRDLAGVHVIERQAHVFERERISVTPFGVALTPEARVLDRAPIGSTNSLARFIERNFPRSEA